jgi:predicted nucleotidyltransferase
MRRTSGPGMRSRQRTHQPLLSDTPMSDLARLSVALDTSQRTLRRAANAGLVRADRSSARRVHVPDRERRYLSSHWPLLTRLRHALRTEPNVRLAVLFGSTARGDDGLHSDVDVLVHMRSAGRFRMMELEDRLAKSTGRTVELVRLRDAEREGTLLSEIVEDGRVLVDRDGVWPGFADDGQAIRQRAERDLEVRAARALQKARRADLG